MLVLAAAATGCDCCRGPIVEAPESIGRVLLFSGYRDGRCRSNELYQVSGDGEAVLSGVEPLRTECPAELVGFAEGGGVQAGPWPGTGTSSLQAYGGVVRIAYPGMRHVSIVLRVLTEEASTPEWVAQQVAYANDLFARFGVGVRLDTVVIRLVPTQDLVAAFTLGCGGVGKLKEWSHYTPGPLNAYLYLWDNTAAKGISCYYPDAQYEPTVLFVYSYDFHRSLAHELGHVLGLQEPDLGHTWLQPGFERPPHPPNLMWGSLSEDLVGVREDITIGQAYRVNLIDRSWWNLSRNAQTGIAPFPSMIRDCRATTIAQGCPELSLRVGQ